MEKTNFTFVTPSRLIRAVMVLLAVSFGVSYASAQCAPPTGLTVTPQCDGSVLIGWDEVPDATSYTVDVEDNMGNPVVNFVNMTATELTITPGTLTPGEMYPFAVTANCGPSTTASSQGVINGTDVFDLPPEITVSNVNDSSCPGSADGSFDVTVDDACGATYDITVDGTTQTAAAGATVTFTGLAGSVAGTNYTVNLALNAAGGCNYDPACVAAVSETVTLFSADATPPVLTISDAAGATPTTPQTLVAPEGECGVQRTWTIFAFDNCGVPTLTSSITNNNLGVFPTAQLVQINNAPTWALEIHAAIGTNTITVTATDADGNQTTQTFTITVEDQRVPEIYGPGNMTVEIPSCEDDAPVNWTVSTVDDCDIQPTLTQTGGPASGSQLAPGSYTVTYTSTDDFGNVANYSFTIDVVQSPSPAPIVDVSGNGQFNVPACEDDALVVFSGNVYDCDLTAFNFNLADLTVNTIPLSPGASGSVAISYTLPQEGFVYFEANGSLTPGSYLIAVSYQGVTVDHAVLVEQDADQPAEIDMPGNLSYLAPVCETGADLSFNVQINDDCDTDLSGAVFTLNGGAAPAIDAAASDPANGLYVWNLPDIPAGSYTLGASYTDGAGNESTSEVTFTVTDQPDNWAPIVIYPSQQINEEIDECSPAEFKNVFFEVTATDNCEVVALDVEADGQTLSPVVGNTYVASVDANTCETVTITAEDEAGNVRNENFQICVEKDPTPAAALACNDLVNITLDEDCQRVVTADMVLEGSFGCYGDADFNVEIFSGADSFGNTLLGHGQFFYEVELGGPQTTNGFTGDFAPANWGINEFDGGTVDFTSTSVTIVGPDDGACFGGSEASAFIDIPMDGNISFDYDFSTVDIAGFDPFIVQIDENGTVTVLVNAGTDETGSVDIDASAGDILAFGVASLDCGFGPGTAIITNFVFSPASGSFGPLDFEPCWGEINAEDKDDPVLECPPSTGTGTIVKDGFVIDGELDTNDPQVVVNNYSCLIDNTQPDLPGTRYVDTEVFQVSEDDVYTFLVTSDVTDLGNVGFAIYQGSFDIDNPCENIIAQSDIPQSPSGAGGGNPLPGSQDFDPFLRLALPLQAGQTYIIATTSFSPDATGDYEYSVCADGEGEVGLFSTTGVFNPFPTSPVTIEVPLYCGDEDAVSVNSLALDIPRCYETDSDGNVILPGNPQERERLLALFERLELTGFPGTLQGSNGGGDVTDNCTNLTVCVSDEIVANGDCGGVTITRTFTATDEKGMEASCAQVLNLRNVVASTDGDSEIWLPPFTAPVECDEDAPLLADGNPSPDLTGYPFVYTVGGVVDLDDDYCNVGATFEDGPRIEVCDGAYKFVRTWTIVDWCMPTDLFTYPQIVKVGDFTAPEVTCPDGSNNPGLAGNVPYPVFSTSPFSCTASFLVPEAQVTDNCSGTSVLTEIVTTVEVDITNAFGQVIGTGLDTVLVATIPAGANPLVSGIPVGEHFFRYTVEDGCGNTTVAYCDFEVRDLIEPAASCDDQLNVSLGGGFGDIGLEEVRARIFAEDFDEGSTDNCGIASLEVRRNKFDFFNYTCGNGFGVTNPILFDGWGPYVDFFCCDVGVEIEVELRVTDVNGNQNICWLNVTPEEKAKPYCFAPQNVTIDCDDLPYGFHPGDTDELEDLFGMATAEDNCNAEAEELPPIDQLDDCGFGRIIRRFRAVDDAGNVSTNVCQQIIDINEVHNYEVKFPADVSLACNEVPDTAELVINEIGCDLIAVSQEDHFFSASGEECYKIFRTFKVINWCQYDGESDPIVLTRDSDCFDGPGNNMFWLLVRPDGSVYLDADNDETPGNNVPGLNFCNFQITDFYQQLPVGSDVGYYEYTQHIRVYDDVKPEIDFAGEDPFCSLDNDACTANVEYDFSIFENCTPDDLEVKVFLDAFADGVIDGELTGALGATFGFSLSGSYPDYTINGVFPIGEHIFEIHVLDGCGNSGREDIPFEVIDCKAPAPICINGISLELMPIDTTGDDDPDTGMAEVWASDYVASPLTDCTGPVKYSINFAGEPNDPDQDVLFFDCDDVGTQVIEIWAYDGAGNSDFCETYVIVQDNMSVCPGPGASMAGAVNTEEAEAVSDVEVSLSGQTSSSMTTGTDGAYSFGGLEEGMDYTVTPQRDGDYLNGVSTFDLVLISKHILGVTPLSSAYQMIAADVNNSGNISTLDLIQLRKLILSIDTEFANNTSWRFVDASYQFPVAGNPWAEQFPEIVNQNNLPEAGVFNADFVAVKIGDVDGSVQANSLAAVENRSFEGTFAFTVADAELKAGNEYTVEFTAADIARIEGYQATLTLDGAVEVVDIVSGLAGEENFGMVYADKGMITTSWNGDAGSEQVFSLVLRANADVKLSEVMGVSSELTKAEAYGKDGSLQDVAIEFTNGTVTGTSFELYQNQPNPFKGETLIGFNLPEAADATVTISDVAGKVLTVLHLDGVKGYNSVVVDAKELPTTGVLTYTVKTGEYTATKKMVIAE